MCLTRVFILFWDANGNETRETATGEEKYGDRPCRRFITLLFCVNRFASRSPAFPLKPHASSCEELSRLGKKNFRKPLKKQNCMKSTQEYVGYRVRVVVPPPHLYHHPAKWSWPTWLAMGQPLRAHCCPSTMYFQLLPSYDRDYHHHKKNHHQKDHHKEILIIK